MKRVHSLIITALLFTGCTSSNFSQKESKPYLQKQVVNEALVVGIANYKGKKNDLLGVNKDIPKVVKLFKSWGFHITVVRDAQSMQLESYLNRYVHLGANDNFIFYYSGHGGQVKDTNKDERDGADEVLALSDGSKNVPFLDDTLFAYLNAIKAKKLVILDACHSGTAFKNFGEKLKVKALSEEELDAVMEIKAFKPKESKLSGKYIVLSASKDKEKSFSIPSKGGLFTTALMAEFQDNGKEKRLLNIRQSIEESIAKSCRNNSSTATPHHPKLSVSNKALKYESIYDFLGIENR